MKYKMMGKNIRVFALMLFMAMGLITSVSGQETLSEEVILEMIEKSLPGWDESVLKVRQGEDWIGHLDFRNVYGVMGDRAPEVEKMPNRAGRLGNEDRVVILDQSRGRVRYVNRTRGWNFETDSKSTAVEAEKALELVASAVRELGVSPDEFGKPRVDTQMGGGAPVGESVIKDRFEMYRIVSIPRMMGEYPVYGSLIRGAVSNRGQIQRLMVEWPAFRMSRKLTMMSRTEVARQAVKEILAQEPFGEVSIRTELVYAATSQDDENPFFVPAVVISVMSRPTPYQLVVPVAKMAR